MFLILFFCSDFLTLWPTVSERQNIRITVIIWKAQCMQLECVCECVYDLVSVRLCVCLACIILFFWWRWKCVSSPLFGLQTLWFWIMSSGRVVCVLVLNGCRVRPCTWSNNSTQLTTDTGPDPERLRTRSSPKSVAFWVATIVCLFVCLFFPFVIWSTHQIWASWLVESRDKKRKKRNMHRLS